MDQDCYTSGTGTKERVCGHIVARVPNGRDSADDQESENIEHTHNAPAIFVTENNAIRLAMVQGRMRLAALLGLESLEGDQPEYATQLFSRLPGSAFRKLETLQRQGARMLTVTVRPTRRGL